MENNTNSLEEEDKPNISSLADDVLKKYNLQESSEKMYQNIEQGIKSNKAIISHLAKDFVEGKIKEKDMISSFQKNLNLTIETTQKLINDVKITIVPYLKKVLEGRLKSRDLEDEQPSADKNVAPVSQQEKKMTIINNKSAIKDKGRSKRLEDISVFPKKTTQIDKLKSSELDRYRESLE